MRSGTRHTAGRRAAAARVVAALALTCIPLSVGAGREPVARLAPVDAATVTGFTAPSRAITLATVRTGRIAELPAAEGAAVQTGDVVVRLDDAVQRQRVHIAQGVADSTLEIELAQVKIVIAHSDLDRLTAARANSAATATELTSAEAEVKSATLELERAKFRQDQAVRELALEQAMLDEFAIKAPFSGFVTEHLKQVGDTVEDREGIARLVQIDPLVVTVDCPIKEAAALRPGSAGAVTPPEGFGPPRTGAVVFVSPVADAASQTLKVKLHVPNADARWVAGMRVEVKFAGDAPTFPAARSDASGER